MSPRVPERPQRTVIMHFYNEAYLLPWWCQHHYPLFDHGILIDYDSTDGSADIIRHYCPGWEIRRSRNRDFGAEDCDREIVMIEADLSGWRIALNTTEFLIGNFETLDEERRENLLIRCYTMVDPIIRGENEPRHDKSLLLQNHHGYDWPDRCVRSLRQAPLDYPAVGRHYWGHKPNSADFAVLWYGFAPYNEHMMARKLQIKKRVPKKDRLIKIGWHHDLSQGTLERQFLGHAQHTQNLKPLIDSFSSSRLHEKRVVHDDRDHVFAAAPQKSRMSPRVPERPQRTVIMHFYNEAYLLPWWCQHHYPLFDHGILIDYDSTDGSADIIRHYCPGWEIRRSDNRYFDANKCDQEILRIEVQLSGWRIALNTTEFFIGDLNKLEGETRLELWLRSYMMIDPLIRGENYPKHDKSLLLQNHHGYYNPHRSCRALRQKALPYYTGRHNAGWPEVRQEATTQDFAILWYSFAPYNEHTIERKLQIQTRIPASDFAGGIGIHHKVKEADIIRQIGMYSPKAIDLIDTIRSLADL